MFKGNGADNIWFVCFLLFVGLVLIIKGGDFFVDAAVWIAETFRVPKFLIGTTIVSVATTLPEMIVSVIAVIHGDYSISVGNAVGSVTANTGLILSIGIIFMNCVIERKEFGVKTVLMMLGSLIIFIFGLSGSFGILPSILLLIIFVYYVYETISSSKKRVFIKEERTIKYKKEKNSKTIIINVLKFILGTTGVILGANLLVENAKALASFIGVSDGIVAITIVAVGTSLPELITTITSIVKKQSDLGVGNIVGANILDLVLILPICSFISKGQLVMEKQNIILDVPASLIISIVAVVPTIINGKFKKTQGKQLFIVALVQADGRLVQDIEYARERATNLGSQTDTLAFAARQSSRRTHQGKIV